jgi:hypothetical protein
MRTLRVVLLSIAVVISLVLTVVPELAIDYINSILAALYQALKLKAITIQSEPVSRAFAVLSPILVSALTVDIVHRVQAARAPRPTPVPLRFHSRPAGLREPYRSIAVFHQFPSFPDQAMALEHLERSVVLANHRLIRVGGYPELDRLLEDQSVVAFVMDAHFREDALQRSRLGATVYLVEPRSSYGWAQGNPATLYIGDAMLDDARIYQTALPLANAYVPDVAKSVGFHGTWATTYGLLAIREDFRGNATGVYWYGHGKILDGRISVNTSESTITLSCKWSQTDNRSPVGTKNHGDAEFTMYAGSDLFSGFWHRYLDPNNPQLWSGTRLSRDIIRSVRSGGDFFLAQHPRTNIIEPGAG